MQTNIYAIFGKKYVTALLKRVSPRIFTLYYFLACLPIYFFVCAKPYLEEDYINPHFHPLFIRIALHHGYEIPCATKRKAGH